MKIAAAFFLLFCVLPWAGGQTITGSLVGTALDNTKAVVPGVSVIATESNTNQQRSATTNNSGNYSISNLPPGIYQVQFKKDGFKTTFQSDVEVRVSANTRVNVDLAVGTLSETVDVQADLPVIQTDSSSLGTTITADQLRKLPLNGRQLETEVLLTPGVLTSAPNSHLSNRGGFNIGGLDEHYISYFVDGIDNVDPVIRIASYRPSIDAIQEIRVEQSGYTAEYGRNGGGVINVTTRSGTNALHGTAWEFFRNDNLDARNVFATLPGPKPVLIRNQFGGTLGGALKENRTFFFGAYEGLRQKAGQSRRASVPTERMRTGDLTEIGGPVLSPSQINPISKEVIQAYPLPNLPGISGNRIETASKIENGNDFSLRLDHQLLSNTHVAGRFSRNVAHVLDPFRTETTGVSNLSSFGQTADRFRTNLGVTFTTVIGSNMVHEFRAGFNRFRQPQLPVNPGTPAQQPLMGFLKTFLQYTISSFDTLGSGAEFRRAVNVYNYMDNLSYAKGNHQFKFGVDMRRYLFNAYNTGPNIFVFTGLRAGSSMADFLMGLPTQTFSFDGSPTANTRKFEFAGYGQDDWKVNSRLTVNYGLRWEFYGRIKERVNKQSFWVPDCNCIRVAGVDASEGLLDNDFNNFAPRLGFAWRPLDDRTVIRASAGIFYDNDQRHNLELAVNPPFFFLRIFTNPPSLNDPFPASQSTTSLRPVTYDKKFRDTYIEQWNLSIQREVLPGTLAQIAYVGNHGVKERRLRDPNQRINGVLPYPGFGSIALFEQAGNSNYHALQVRVERGFSKNFAYTSSYTWSHAIDDRPGQGAGRAPNNYNLQAERADSDYDVRHSWASSLSFRIPWATNKPWGRWSLNAMGIVQSGRPFTVTLPSAPNGERPNVAQGVDWRPANQGPDHWINPAAFTTPVAGTFGNLGRNALRGPGFANFDFSLVKVESIGEANVEFRAEVFNIFNHPNFSVPSGVMGTSLGVISATISPERQIQLGVKVGF